VREIKVLGLERKNDGVMDNKSGDSELMTDQFSAIWMN